MRLPNDPSKFSSQFKYAEVAHYIPDRKSVIRKQNYQTKEPVLLDWNQIREFSDKYGNTGIYTSVFQYRSRALDVNHQLGPLYFDLDSDSIEQSRSESLRLYDHLRGFIPEHAIRTYFTGKKGFHIECEPLALGINPGHDLAGTFRFIASQLRELLSLETLDFQVYDPRRMWRVPGTKHQSTGLFKNPISRRILAGPVDGITGFCTELVIEDVPEQNFNGTANEWYREQTYQYEESKQARDVSPAEMLARFNKGGTNILRKSTEGEFDPVALMDNCHAINDLWRKAERDHHLEHEERLFLCSILSYSDEAIRYLHAILSCCDDYNFEKSNAHIKDWVRRREMGIGGRPYTCKRANAAGVGCGDCELEPKKKWVKAGDSWVESEEYADPSPIRWAYDRRVKGDSK